MNKESCIFCKIVEKKLPSDIIYEDEAFIVIKDIKPVTPIHLLIITKKHLECLAEVSENDGKVLASLLLTINKVTKKEKITDFRVIINNGTKAGQTVFHLHAHILAGEELSEKLL